jgi:hypothetical protein
MESAERVPATNALLGNSPPHPVLLDGLPTLTSAEDPPRGGAALAPPFKRGSGPRGGLLDRNSFGVPRRPELQHREAKYPTLLVTTTGRELA